MTFRIYIRDDHQQVTHKTVTEDPAAARAAFRSLVERTDLDGQRLLAVLNRDGRPVAHHDFSSLPPHHNPLRYWRGRIDELNLAAASITLASPLYAS